jgi:hypothetical protein
MDTHAELTFLAADSPPPVYVASVGGGAAQLNVSGLFETHDVPVIDGRALAERFTLDVQGFELVRHDSAVADIYDDAQRARLHAAECADLVERATGAARTHVFDHTLRSADPQRREEKRSREPTAIIHNDYTPRSAPRRARDILGGEAEALLERPFAIVNVWRPIRAVESFPLTACDARSVAPGALIPAERRAEDRIGEIYMLRFDPGQRWIYFPAMTPDEALLIKTYDSREDGRARWAAHTAFADPHTRPGAPPRESIETRVFAFFGKDSV